MLVVDSTCPVNWQHPLNRGLAAWWLAGVQGRTGGAKWYDLVRNRQGTLTNMDPKTDWVGTSRSGLGAGLAFELTDDYVSIPSWPKVEFTATSKFSLGVWFRNTNPSTSSHLINHSWTGTARAYLLAQSLSSSFAIVAFIRGTATDSIAGGTTGTNDGLWHFAVLTYDAGAAKLFLDGKQDATKTLNVGTGNLFTDASFTLSNSANEILGQLDDVRIWNRALSSQEVRAYYDLSRQGYQGLLNRADRILGRVPAAGFNAAWAPRANSVITGITSA